MKEKRIFLITQNGPFFEATLAKRIEEEKFNCFFLEKSFQKEIKGEKKKALEKFLLSFLNFLKNADYLIFALENDLLFSFSFKSTFLRKNPQIPLQKQELENILQKTQQKIFNFWQNEGKRFLKVKTIDLKIADASCKKVFVNDHLVASPLGFKAKSISFLLENTLIDKNLLYSLKAGLKEVFKVNPSLSIKFIEKDFCLATTLETLFKQKFLYLGSWKDEISLSVLGEEIFEKNILKIHLSFFEKAIEKISEAFEVKREVAEKLYFLALKNKVSLRFSKKLNEILKPAFLALEDNLKFLYLQLKIKNKKINQVLIVGDDLLWIKSKKINLNRCFQKNLKKHIFFPEECLLKLKIKVKLKRKLEKNDFLKIVFLNFPFLKRNEIVESFLSKIIFRI